MRQIGQHAVVIGASLGGLLAARALADAYEHVTILERDTLPATDEPRKGVPQGRHAHGLLARGREILEDFFPGLTQELIAKGAVTSDLTDDLRWFNDGGFHCQFASGLIGLAVSRPTLEGQVRRRLIGLPNVTLVENCDVLGPVTDAGGERITGLRLIRRAAGGAEEVLAADLVVDASGRGSRTPAWLEALGYDRPTEERVQVGLGYTTRYYRRTPGQCADTAIIVGPSVQNKRTGVLIAQEGDRWVVTLMGYFGDHAPADDAGFLAFARSLATPEIYEVIKDAEPITDIMTYKFPASQRRRYEGLARFPEGLLVIGDAICSFNPVYGQGMSVAAQEALVLHECLARGPEQLTRRYFQQVAKVVDIPWSMAVGADLRFPEVDAPRTRLVRFINWYMGKLHVAARRDPAVVLAFQQVANLKAAPSSLLRPSVTVRVLRGNLGSAKGDRRADPALALR